MWEQALQGKNRIQDISHMTCSLSVGEDGIGYWVGDWQGGAVPSVVPGSLVVYLKVKGEQF